MSAPQEENNAPNILEVPIDSFGTAMGLMYEFLNIANRRGAFRIEESAKALACISFMQRALMAPAPEKEETVSKTNEKVKQPTKNTTSSVQPTKKKT